MGEKVKGEFSFSFYEGLSKSLEKKANRKEDTVGEVVWGVGSFSDRLAVILRSLMCGC